MFIDQLLPELSKSPWSWIMKRWQCCIRFSPHTEVNCLAICPHKSQLGVESWNYNFEIKHYAFCWCSTHNRISMELDTLTHTHTHQWRIQDLSQRRRGGGGGTPTHFFFWPLFPPSFTLWGRGTVCLPDRLPGWKAAKKKKKKKNIGVANIFCLPPPAPTPNYFDNLNFLFVYVNLKEKKNHVCN